MTSFERQVFRLLSGGSSDVRTLVHGMIDAGWSAKKIVGFFLFHGEGA